MCQRHYLLIVFIPIRLRLYKKPLSGIPAMHPLCIQEYTVAVSLMSISGLDQSEYRG